MTSSTKTREDGPWNDFAKPAPANGPWDDFTPAKSDAGQSEGKPDAKPSKSNDSSDAGGFLHDLGRQIGLTARHGLEGAAQAAQIVTEPIRYVTDNITPDRTQTLSDLVAGNKPQPKSMPLGVMASRLADYLGLPSPQTPDERVIGDATRLVAGAGATMGAGAALAKVPGMVGKAGEFLAAQPVQQIVSAAGAGTAGGAAKENGASEGVQAVAALAGGLGTSLAMDTAMKLGKGVLKPLMAERATQVDEQIAKALKAREVDWADVPKSIQQGMRAEVKKALKSGDDLNAEAVNRLLDFKRVPGTTPTRGSVSLDPVQITRERNLAKTGANSSDTGLQGLTQVENQNNQALIDALNTAGAASADDAYSAGQKVINSLQGGLDTEKATVSQLYGAARDSAGRSYPLDGATFTRTANQVLDDALLGHALPPSVASHLNRIANGEVPFTVDYAEQLKTAMGNLRRATADGQTRMALDKVRQALDDTPVMGLGEQTAAAGARPVNPGNMPAVPNAPEMGQDAIAAFTQARTANRAMMQRIEGNPALKAIYDGEVSPEDFVRKFVIGPGAKVDNVQRLGKEIANDPDAVQAVRSSIATWLKARALGGGATDDTARFNATRYQAALSSLGGRKLSAFFSPEEIEQFRAIGRVASYTTAQPAGSAVNNSNSGALLMGKGLDWLDSLAGKLPIFGVGPQVSAVARGVQQSQAKNVAPALVNQASQTAKPPMLSPAVVSGSLFALPSADQGQDEHSPKPADEIGIESPQSAFHGPNVSAPALPNDADTEGSAQDGNAPWVDFNGRATPDPAGLGGEQGEQPASDVQAIPAPPDFTSQLRSDGTMAVSGGDPAELRALLAQAGIPARSIAPMRNGLLVGRTQVQRVQELLGAMRADSEQPQVSEMGKLQINDQSAANSEPPSTELAALPEAAQPQAAPQQPEYAPATVFTNQPPSDGTLAVQGAGQAPIDMAVHTAEASPQNDLPSPTPAQYSQSDLSTPADQQQATAMVQPQQDAPVEQQAAAQPVRQPTMFHTPERIQALRDSGDERVANLLARQKTSGDAQTELASMREQAPDLPFHGNQDFEGTYAAQRLAGMSPAEASAHAGIFAATKAVAPQIGMPEKAVKALEKKLAGLPIDEAPAFVQRFTNNLIKSGLMEPSEGAMQVAAVLGEARDRSMHSSLRSVYPTEVTTAKEPESVKQEDTVSIGAAPPPRVAHDFELAPRIDGTLVVRGEKQAVADLLRAHGITRIMPFHDGVLVGKSMAGQAFDILSA